MRKIQLVLLAFIFISSGMINGVFAGQPTWQWANQPMCFGGEIYNNDIVVNKTNGDYYVTGTFKLSKVEFDTNNVITPIAGQRSFYVAKYNKAGMIQWAFQGESSFPSESEGNRLAVDADGNVVVTGTFSGTPKIGDSTLSASGGNDIFIAKFTPSGQMTWLKTGGGTVHDAAMGISTDASNNIYIAGYTEGNGSFGGTPISTNNGSRDVLMAKLSPAGAWLWVNVTGGTGSDGATDIAVTFAGEIFVAGDFTGTYDVTTTVGTTSLVSAGGSDVFMGSIDAAGLWQWAVKNGGTGNDKASALALDNNSNIYIVGSFTDQVTIAAGGGPVTIGTAASTDDDTYIGKHRGSDGQATWYTTVSNSTNADVVGGITVNPVTGNFAINGRFNGSVDFVNDPAVPAVTTTVAGIGKATTDHYTASYGTNGNYLWSKLVNDVTTTSGVTPGLGGIALDKEDGIFTVGNYSIGDTVIAGVDTMQSSLLLGNMFIAKIHDRIDSLTVSGSVFCAGDSLTVDFAARGVYTIGNRFWAQLSDKNGKFKNPTIIGSLAGIGNGRILCAIPKSIPYGTGYKIRVTSDNPKITGAWNTGNITVNDNPNAAIVPSGPTSFCPGDNVILAGPLGPNLTYQWIRLEDMSVKATSKNITIDTTNAGTYKLRIQNTSTGCVDTTNALYTSASGTQQPVVTPSKPKQAGGTGSQVDPYIIRLCTGESVTLTGDAGYQSYAWSTGETTTSITIDKPTTGIVLNAVDTNATCNILSNYYNVEVVTLATPAISAGGPTSFCTGGSVLLTLTNAASFPSATYSWSNGPIGVTNSVSATGAYTVTVIDSNGCSVTSNTITVNQIAQNSNFPLLVNGVVEADQAANFCDSDSVSLDLGPGYTYILWSTGATTQSINVGDAGTYSVKVVSACPPGDTLTSEVITLTKDARPPSPIITQVNSCTLMATTSFGKMQWYKNGVAVTDSFGTGQSYTMGSTGTYQIGFMNTNCTAMSNSIVVLALSNCTIGRTDGKSFAGTANVYPNPAVGNITVDADLEYKSNVTVSIVNVLGATVYSADLGELSVVSHQVDMSQQPAGIYMLKVATENGSIVKRIVKE